MGYSKKTIRLIAEHEALGYEIIEGNNPRLNQTRKYSGYDCVRLCQTNGSGGRSKRTVWAVKELEVIAEHRFMSGGQSVTLTEVAPPSHEALARIMTVRS